MLSAAVLEDLAASVLRDTGLTAPINPLALADLCGLHIDTWSGRRGVVLGDTIAIKPTLPPRARAAAVAHETAHWLLQDEGLEDTEENATRLSHALLLPRKRFDTDLRVTWNPLELQAEHVHAPASWIVRRIAQLRPAVATIIDDRRIVERYTTRRLAASRRRLLTEHEFELVAEALATERPAGGRAARGWAVPYRAGVHRVVVVAETRALAA